MDGRDEPLRVGATRSMPCAARFGLGCARSPDARERVGEVFVGVGGSVPLRPRALPNLKPDATTQRRRRNDATTRRRRERCGQVAARLPSALVSSCTLHMLSVACRVLHAAYFRLPLQHCCLLAPLAALSPNPPDVALSQCNAARLSHACGPLHAVTLSVLSVCRPQPLAPASTRRAPTAVPSSTRRHAACAAPAQ